LAGGTGTASNSGDPLGLVPNGIIQVGQGFIVKSTSSELLFTNSMRVGNHEDQFLRNRAQNRSRIWLSLSGENGAFSQAMIAYMPHATPGIDASIDGRVFKGSGTALSSIIDSQEFAIQGRGLPFNRGDVVALGFRSELAGHYTIALAHSDGLFASDQGVYLKDNLMNTMQDLKAGPYSFASNAGVFNARFEIVYTELLGANQPAFDAKSVVVYKQNQELVVNTGGIIMSRVKVFDGGGRLLLDKKNINASETRLNIVTLRKVLFLQISSKANGIVRKKVIN
jgi:hypothetical protein